MSSNFAILMNDRFGRDIFWRWSIGCLGQSLVKLSPGNGLAGHKEALAHRRRVFRNEDHGINDIVYVNRIANSFSLISRDGDPIHKLVAGSIVQGRENGP